MWDVSSLTRDQTHAAHWKEWSLHHWTAIVGTQPTFLMLLPSASWVIEYLLHARLCPAYRDTYLTRGMWDTNTSLMSVKNEQAGFTRNAEAGQISWEGRAMGLAAYEHREERKGIQEGHAEPQPE